MPRFLRFAAAALIAAIGPTAAHAAATDVRMLIECTFEESVSLSSIGSYEGDSKVGTINSWFGELVLAKDNQRAGSTLTLHWNPSASGGPVLEITADDTVHNLLRLISRTGDSVIAVTSASDRLTAESWLITLNFAREEVIATRVQTNIAGVKGQVLRYDCTFGF